MIVQLLFQYWSSLGCLLGNTRFNQNVFQVNGTSGSRGSVPLERAVNAEKRWLRDVFMSKCLSLQCFSTEHRCDPLEAGGGPFVFTAHRALTVLRWNANAVVLLRALMPIA